jgi:hypothetical protein
VRSRFRFLILVLVLALLLLWGVRERFDPRLALYVHDLLASTPKRLTVPLDRDLAIRLYANTRPHIGKIASLQKGLVLVHRRRELVEEGYGFGLPIIEADGVAYNSRHADTSLAEQDGQATLVKTYWVDVADRPVQFLRLKYQDVPPLGTVVFTYTIRPPDIIDVKVDFRGLNANWDRAYLMNEQGARAFDQYRTPAGVREDGATVGIWRESAAPFGCWEAPAYAVAFCVEADSGQPGYIGRERYNQYNWLGIYTLSWSGIDVRVEAPRDFYTYTIRVDSATGGTRSMSDRVARSAVRLDRWQRSWPVRGSQRSGPTPGSL